MLSSGSAGKEGEGLMEADGKRCEGVEERQWDRGEGGDRNEAAALAGEG